MFEYRKKNRFRTVLLLLGIVFVAAFILGYYLNSGTRVEDDDLSKVNNFEIPDSLKSFSKPNQENDFVSTDDSMRRVEESTVLSYVTYFKMCGHKVEKNIKTPQAFIGLNIEELQQRIEGWQINEMTEERVIFTRDIETFCPRHFIIGVKDDNIAIYIYNESGEKILKEKTDIDINILTPEDQMLLHSGIVADTEDDMELKIEGFSN